ncbi:hypothetical protein ACFS32_11415 [Novosphingobium pokkalii]|uniref:hypothetical protein n=1 Tax=Novosphingobium pokkalii TaxID=1770194 RepID=UPI00362C9D29
MGIAARAARQQRGGQIGAQRIGRCALAQGLAQRHFGRDRIAARQGGARLGPHRIHRRAIGHRWPCGKQGERGAGQRLPPAASARGRCVSRACHTV